MTGTPIDFERLVGYVTGDLDAAEAAEVSARLAESPADAARAERIRALLATMRSDDSVAPSRRVVERVLRLLPARGAPAAAAWLESARRLVATLVFDSRMQPALAGFRSGSEGAFQLAYEGEAGRVDVQVSAVEGTDDERWRLRGQVAADKAADLGPLVAIAAGGKEPVATAEPDASGRFKMDLPSGAYDLVLAIDGERAAMVLPRLDLGEEPGEAEHPGDP